MREKSNSRSVTLDNALINLPLQFANYLVDAQQNYETNYKSMQKMQAEDNNVKLENAFLSVFVGVAVLSGGKFYYENIDGIHGQTQTNPDS